MIEPSLQIGGGNWANKSDKLLGYHKDGANFYADELTFSRNSEGSYTDANGLVQTMPYNLVQYSEQFDNGAWSKSNASITANSTTAPNGTTNADKLVADNLATLGSAFLEQNESIGAAAYTISIFAKKGEFNTIQLYARDNASASNNTSAKFNLETGIVSDNSDSGIITYILGETIEFIDGWYKCSLTFSTSSAITIRTRYFVLDSVATTGDGTSGIYIYGAQLNQGSTALPYFATTTRLNLARVDYKDNPNGSLLLEPQRTNLLTYSEDFSNASWAIVGSGMTKTINYALSPNNDLTACRITTTTSGSAFYSNIGTVSGVHTRSLWVKSNNGASQTILFENGDSVTATTSWQRVESITNGSAIFPIQLSGANLDILIWKPQCELGSYSTSYIKSEGAATTRLQDSCVKTGISDKIGQTEGSVFFDFKVDAISAQTNDPVLWYMKDGGSGERYVELYANGNLVYVEVNGGGVIAFMTKTGLTIGSHKCAIAYANNDFVFYVDGLLIATDVNGTPSGFSTFGLQYYNDIYRGQQKVNQVQLYKTRLSNAELATLTTI